MALLHGTTPSVANIALVDTAVNCLGRVSRRIGTFYLALTLSWGGTAMRSGKIRPDRLRIGLGNTRRNRQCAPGDGKGCFRNGIRS